MRYSDERLKRNIEKLDTRQCVDGLSKPRPVRYKLKPSSGNRDNSEMDQLDIDSLKRESEKIHMGFVAQEVSEVFPSLVSKGGSDQTMMVNYEELIPILVEVYQYQNNLIKSLQSDLEFLMENSEYDEDFEDKKKRKNQNRLGSNSPNPFDEETTIPVFF